MAIFSTLYALIVALCSISVPPPAPVPTPAPTFTVDAASAPEAISGSQCSPANSTLEAATDLFMSGGYDGSTGEFLGEEDSALVDLILRLKTETEENESASVDIMQVLFDHCVLAEVEPGTQAWDVYVSMAFKSQSAKGYYWCLLPEGK